MRRITHNTTAIVTCLSLLMPQIAAAQDQNPNQDGLSAIIDQVKKAAQDQEDAVRNDADRPNKRAEGDRKSRDEPGQALKAEEAKKKPKEKPQKASKDDAKPKAKPGNQGKGNNANNGAKGDDKDRDRQEDGQNKPAKEPEARGSRLG